MANGVGPFRGVAAQAGDPFDAPSICFIKHGLYLEAMTSNPGTPLNADEAIKALHAEAARLLERKNSDESIITILTAKGVERHYAEMIIDNARTDKDHRKAFYKLLIRGGFIFLAGLVMTVWGYLFSPPGGVYFVFWGIMIYGLTDLIRAFILFRKG